MPLVLRVFRVALVLFTTTLILLPFHLIAILFRDPLRHLSPFIWHKVACWLLCIKITHIGALAQKRPLMIAANHASWLDILLLGSSAPLVFIAKSEVKTWPVFGHLAQLQQTVFIDRNTRRKTKEQVGTIAGRLKRNEVVVLFPEGTTSDGNFVLPFKSALFGAVENAQKDLPDLQLAIQPVSVAYKSAHGIPLGRANRDLIAWPGDVSLLPHIKKVIDERSIGIEITYGEPILFDHGMKRSEIAKLCENSVRTALNKSLSN